MRPQVLLLFSRFQSVPCCFGFLYVCFRVFLKPCWQIIYLISSFVRVPVFLEFIIILPIQVLAPEFLLEFLLHTTSSRPPYSTARPFPFVFLDQNTTTSFFTTQYVTTRIRSAEPTDQCRWLFCWLGYGHQSSCRYLNNLASSRYLYQLVGDRAVDFSWMLGAHQHGRLIVNLSVRCASAPFFIWEENLQRTGQTSIASNLLLASQQYNPSKLSVGVGVAMKIKAKVGSNVFKI